MMAKKVQSLTEFMGEFPDVHNSEGWINTLVVAGNLARARNIFDRYGIDLAKEREGYDVYALALVYEASQSEDARKETSLRQIETSKTFYTILIEKLRPLAEDPYFCKSLGLDVDEIKNRLTATELALATFDGKRVGPVKSIKYWLRYILPFLKSQGLGETKRVNLIRDLFIEFDVPVFGIGHKVHQLGSLDRRTQVRDQIREWDREIMQAPKSNSPQ